ncbi:hypothetical protein P7K49_005979, partial [Saguinus oedipus]
MTFEVGIILSTAMSSRLVQCQERIDFPFSTRQTWACAWGTWPITAGPGWLLTSDPDFL